MSLFPWLDGRPNSPVRLTFYSQVLPRFEGEGNINNSLLAIEAAAHF
jgi:hypothetical protein